MMKNYIQQIIELFGHNEYSLATRRKVQRWLADDNHAEEKKEALHTLWQQAGEQKVPRGMQQSILRMQQNLGMQSVPVKSISYLYGEQQLFSCWQYHLFLSILCWRKTNRKKTW